MKKFLVFIVLAILTQTAAALYEYNPPPGHTELKVISVTETWDYIPTECRREKSAAWHPTPSITTNIVVVVLSNGRKHIMRQFAGWKMYGEPFEKPGVFYYDKYDTEYKNPYTSDTDDICIYRYEERDGRIWDYTKQWPIRTDL